MADGKRVQRDALENGDRLVRDIEDAKSLQRVSSLLIEEGAGDWLFDEILECAIAIMRADFGSMQVLDDENQELRLVTWRNFHPEAAEFWKTVSIETGTACGSALKHGERIVIPDVHESALRDSPSMRLFDLSGIVAIQSTPLISRSGRLVGMVSTHWNQAHRPNDHELLLFDILARQAADFIERRHSEEALRRSERHAQILLAELQHRVRNTLGIVGSIARRTAENSDSADEMLVHFQGRLDAFSRVQAALTRSPGATVDLRSLIGDELIAHVARDGQRVRIEGPLVSLDATTAERLSLAIHELAINAVKHGALANRDGRIHISWSREKTNGSADLLLSWKESGAERDGHDLAREGFGMALLRRSLPYDLQATTEVELMSEGLRFELRMPFPPPPRGKHLTA